MVTRHSDLPINNNPELPMSEAERPEPWIPAALSPTISGRPKPLHSDPISITPSFPAIRGAKTGWPPPKNQR